MASKELTKKPLEPDVLAIIARGDLISLTEEQRTRYYVAQCERLGFDPLSRPFDFIEQNESYRDDNGNWQKKPKLVFYSNQSCANQLRRTHGVSLTIIDKSITAGVVTVTIEAKDNSGRVDTDIGTVAPKSDKPADLAIAMKKAVTQAKRRVTLAFCGVGTPDEDDAKWQIDQVSPAIEEPAAADPAPPVEAQATDDTIDGEFVDTDTGELFESEPDFVEDQPQSLTAAERQAYYTRLTMAAMGAAPQGRRQPFVQAVMDDLKHRYKLETLRRKEGGALLVVPKATDMELAILVSEIEAKAQEAAAA